MQDSISSHLQAMWTTHPIKIMKRSHTEIKCKFINYQANMLCLKFKKALTKSYLFDVKVIGNYLSDTYILYI